LPERERRAAVHALYGRNTVMALEALPDLPVDDLTVAAVASRQRISESYVRKLFESEGSSFSEWVLGERLIRAHRMLTDPRFAGRSINSVAFDAGFGDISYFNRSFRRRFGATPSEIRAEAKYR
jgi:AraC-like DNA-binding protein